MSLMLVVSKKDIENARLEKGSKHRTENCPLAQCGQRKFPGKYVKANYSGLFVGLDAYKPKDQRRWKQFIFRYDNGGWAKPGTRFYMEQIR